MVRIGKKQSSGEPDSAWVLTPAEILDFKYGLVHTTSTGVDAMYDRHSASKKLSLRVEPVGGVPYDATLKIDRDGPNTPDVSGTRVEVLVDPGDPQRLALPADPTFTLPGGRTWQPAHGIAGGIAAASKRGDAKEIARLTAELREQSAAGGTPAPVVAPPVAGETQDPLDRLEKLAKLRDSGVLTEQEFTEQKAKILGEPT
jgi:hypothetical protein